MPNQLSMFEMLDDTTSNLLMSLPPDSPVRTSAWQATVPGLKARSLVYGGSCFGLSAKFAPGRLYWKTWRLSRTATEMRKQANIDPQTHSWYLVRCPAWGMTRNGGLYPLRIAAHRTSGDAGSVWATPVASDQYHRQLPADEDFRVTETGMLRLIKQNSLVRLSQQTQYYRKTSWYTPIKNDGIKSGRVAPERRNGLSGQVRWATPMAQDGKETAPTSGFKRKSPNLNVQAADKPGDYLNPDWVEQLMGFPVGWTDTR
jgi:hypothetical protein